MSTNLGRPSAARRPAKRRVPAAFSPLVLCPLSLLLAAALTLAGCSGKGPALQASPGPATPAAGTAAPKGTPLDVAAEMGRAEALWSEGEFEAALETYSALAAAASGQDRQDALWQLALASIARNDPATARKAVEDLLRSGPVPDLRRKALCLLGKARLDLGDDRGAEEAFKDYLALGGEAPEYAHLRLAEIAARRGDNAAAADHARQAVAPDASPEWQARARFALASYQQAAGDLAAAARTYWTLAYAPLNTPAEDRGEATWRLAGLLDGQGEKAAAAREWRRLISDYPWHQRALEALDAAPVLGYEVPARERAMVLFRHRRNSEAEAAFREALSQGDGDAAEAHYYLGVLAERAGDPQAALAEYGEAAALARGQGDATLLGQALWDRATVVESVGTAEEAAQAYAAVADQAPGTANAAEALFRAGFIDYRQGQAAQSVALWELYLGAAGSDAERARALFWLGKAARALGQDDAAARDFEAAASVAPSAYYGLRAKAEAAGSSWPAPQAVAAPSQNWQEAETWLGSVAGPEDVAASEAFFASRAWRRAAELQGAGLESVAKDEFAALLESAAGRPWVLYRIARWAQEQGLTSLAARAAQRLAEGHPEAPKGLLLLAYPPAYLELAAQYALPEGLSPLLLLALIRQESVYDPGAVSYAGASGLTQVMPATAMEIATELGDKGFRLSDLARPRVSLRFGAHYLGKQMAEFGGSLPAALAAYNGGPGNAGRWLEAAQGDPDLFVESISFAETKAYVQIVLANYAQYLYAYGLASGAFIPLR